MIHCKKSLTTCLHEQICHDDRPLNSVFFQLSMFRFYVFHEPILNTVRHYAMLQISVTFSDITNNFNV
jgi:hypothetical protein